MKDQCFSHSLIFFATKVYYSKRCQNSNTCWISAIKRPACSLGFSSFEGLKLRCRMHLSSSFCTFLTTKCRSQLIVRLPASRSGGRFLSFSFFLPETTDAKSLVLIVFAFGGRWKILTLHFAWLPLSTLHWHFLDAFTQPLVGRTKVQIKCSNFQIWLVGVCFLSRHWLKWFSDGVCKSALDWLDDFSVLVNLFGSLASVPSSVWSHFSWNWTSRMVSSILFARPDLQNSTILCCSAETSFMKLLQSSGTWGSKIDFTANMLGRGVVSS